MYSTKPIVIVLILSFIMCGGIMAAELTFDRYHTPAAVNTALKDFASATPSTTKLHSLAHSAGGRDILMLEIGPEVKGMHWNSLFELDPNPSQFSAISTL